MNGLGGEGGGGLRGLVTDELMADWAAERRSVSLCHCCDSISLLENPRIF